MERWQKNGKVRKSNRTTRYKQEQRERRQEMGLMPYFRKGKETSSDTVLPGHWDIVFISCEREREREREETPLS